MLINAKRAVVVSATGVVFTGTGMLKGASLRAAAATAKATIREVDGSGAQLAILAAGVNLADHLPEGGIPFTQALHVTLEGAGAECIVYI